MADERRDGHCQVLMTRGTEVYRLWPGGARGSVESVLSKLIDAVIFEGVDPVFTAALADLTSALHQITMARHSTPRVPPTGSDNREGE